MSFIIPFWYLSGIAAFISEIQPMRIVCAGWGRCNRVSIMNTRKRETIHKAASVPFFPRHWPCKAWKNRGRIRDGDKDRGWVRSRVSFVGLSHSWRVSIHAPITIGDMRLSSCLSHSEVLYHPRMFRQGAWRGWLWFCVHSSNGVPLCSNCINDGTQTRIKNMHACKRRKNTRVIQQ